MITQSTLNLIKKFEGVKKVAYKDSIGKWTIGVGHLILVNEHSLLTKELIDQEIDDLLMKDLQQVQSCIQRNVLLTPLKQTQFDAIASFIFNLGCTNFSSSTLLKKINSKDTKEEITKQWLRWDKANSIVVPGLTKRRQEEINIYFS